MTAAALPPLELTGRLDADGVARTDNKAGDDRRDDDTDRDDEPEPPREVFKGNGNVHAPQARNERGNGDDERDDRQQFHDDVHVVGDDGSVRVHRTRENVPRECRGKYYTFPLPDGSR